MFALCSTEAYVGVLVRALTCVPTIYSYIEKYKSQDSVVYYLKQGELSKAMT